MSPQRYEAVNAHDEDDHVSPITPTSTGATPSSPPPSFHSRASSPTSRPLLNQDPLATEAEQTLADTFDDGAESDNENDVDDRQRLMRADTQSSHHIEENEASTPGTYQAPQTQRRVAQYPVFAAPPNRTQPRSTNIPSFNDGVFANLSAKLERGETQDEKPPTYEQAAADATPPYWETTILAPGMTGDEVYVDGLPVGSVFSFIWNGMISMSFQLVGFLLTYLLHTTHAAKNGSRAGLGLTLVQYGFYMRGSGNEKDSSGNPGQFATAPPDPNAHSFDPTTVAGDATGVGATDGSGTTMSGISGSDWISFILMIVGWFILIRSVSDFLRARRHEQLVLRSPDRGLPVPIIAEGESTETAV